MYTIFSCQMVRTCLLLPFEVSVVLACCTVQNVNTVKQIQMYSYMYEFKYKWAIY